MIDFNDKKHIHFIGIGGVSVIAIALIMRHNGFTISGSDKNRSDITKSLEDMGVNVYYGHFAKNVENANMVIYTSAVADDNPEILRAKELNITLVSRAEALGSLMTQYTHSVGISGTHGKTSVTSMVASLLEDFQSDPTILAGAYNHAFKGFVKIGDNNIIVTEACEYKENFLNFAPTIGVILNMEEDHMDYYDDLNHIIKSFIKFAQNVPPSGYLILNSDDYNSNKVISQVNSNILTFGINQDADFRAMNITFDENSRPHFDLYIKGEFIEKINLSVPGKHNLYNALAAFAVAWILNKEVLSYCHKIENFKNVSRRFELLGTFKGQKVYDDYAHHPSEIKTTLSTAKMMQDVTNVIGVFQPHTYSRLRELLDDFSNCFGDSDLIIISDIYPAREIDPGNIHSKDLYDLLIAKGIKALYFDDFDKIESYIRANSTGEDLIITLGAGDINKIGKNLVK